MTPEVPKGANALAHLVDCQRVMPKVSQPPALTSLALACPRAKLSAAGRNISWSQPAGSDKSARTLIALPTVRDCARFLSLLRRDFRLHA